MIKRRLPAILFSLLVLTAAGAGESAADVYRALGVKTDDVLTGTVLTSRVLPGGVKQVVAVATYLTGGRDKNDAVNVKLGVFDRAGDELRNRYLRDFGQEQGGFVAHGELELMDLDGDGVNEIIVSYEDFEDPLIEQRVAEVILYEDGFRVAWSGPVEYDATKAARSVALERRDRFVREIDYGATLRTRGVTLFLKKQVVAIAGERLPEPKIVRETFALRQHPAYR